MESVLEFIYLVLKKEVKNKSIEESNWRKIKKGPDKSGPFEFVARTGVEPVTSGL